MKRITRSVCRMAALTACLLLAAVANADHKPNHDRGGGNGGGGGSEGGGAGSNGGGVIYFRYGGEIYTMNDGGGSVAVVSGFPHGFAGYGEPSYQLHANKRWFLQTYDLPGEFYPDFHSDGTLKDLANRRVFYALSDGGNAVELTIPPDLEPLGGKWTVDDGYVSYPGRAWDIDPASSNYGSVLEGGLYRTKINFDPTTGDVTGAGASELVFPMSLVPSNAYRQSNESTPAPDMLNFDWAPDGKQFVFDTVGRHELRIGNTDNADTGELQVLFENPDRPMSNPLWSPAGDKIMFNYRTGWNEVDSINPDGSGLKKLVGSSPNWTHRAGVWSPTGSHLLFKYFDHFLTDSHILRATANGTQRIRLTGEEFGGNLTGPHLMGWRDVGTSAAARFASVPEPTTSAILLIGLSMCVGRLRWRG